MNHLAVIEGQEEGASDQKKIYRGHFPSPLVVESLVPLAVDVWGRLLHKGNVDHQIAPFQAVPTAHVVEDNKWEERDADKRGEH